MKTIDSYISQGLLKIVHSSGDLIWLGGFVERNNAKAFVCITILNFDNTNCVDALDDDVNLLMHELLKQAGFDVDNYE